MGAFIAKHKIGILTTIVFHVALLLYVNVKTLKAPVYQPKNHALIEFDFTEENEKIEDELPSDEEVEQPTDEDIMEQIKNLYRDKNDQRDQSSNNYNEQSIEQELEEKYKQLAEDIKAQREKEGKHFDPSSYEFTHQEKAEDKKNTPSAGNQVTGKVITECDIPGRKCYAKTPAYRCPAGGTIHVDIKVNQKGVVTSARVNESKSSSTNACLIKESLKYAKRSKANQDFNGPASVSGSITYRFINQ